MSAKASWNASWSGRPGFEVAAAQAVEDRVGRLVGDDVVGQARVDDPGLLVTRGPHRTLERSEQDRARIRVVVRIRLAEGTRHEVQLVAGKAPRHSPAERLLEGSERPGGDRIDVLVPEFTVLGERLVGDGAEAVVVGPAWPAGWSRGVQAVVRAVVVDDLESRALGPGQDRSCGTGTTARRSLPESGSKTDGSWGRTVSRIWRGVTGGSLGGAVFGMGGSPLRVGSCQSGPYAAGTRLGNGLSVGAHWRHVGDRRLPGADAALARAVRAGDGVAARRIDPDDRLHGALSAVHRVRRGPARHRCRRQRLSRLPGQLHLADPGPRPSGRGRGRRGAGPARLGLRGADRDRDRAGRGDPPPGPSIERLRFTSSGTEATMFAIRAARAFTRRPLIAKFDHSYHGTHDGGHGRHGRGARGDVRPDRRAAVGRCRRRRAGAAGPRGRPRRDHHRAGPGAPAASGPRNPSSCGSFGRSPSATARSSSSTRSSRSGSRPAAPRNASACGRT